MARKQEVQKYQPIVVLTDRDDGVNIADRLFPDLSRGENYTYWGSYGERALIAAVAPDKPQLVIIMPAESRPVSGLIQSVRGRNPLAFMMVLEGHFPVANIPLPIADGGLSVEKKPFDRIGILTKRFLEGVTNFLDIQHLLQTCLPQLPAIQSRADGQFQLGASA